MNILDNMIASGDIPPVIVVSATFDAENQPQSFSRSVEELSVFHNDLRENLMPYIEERFHTYAEDVTEEGFEASREHRAFGGFSLGAVTTWYQFIYNLDYIKNFVPMSGDCWIIRTYGGRDYPVETVDYTHINPDKTVEIVNYLDENAAAGDTVFYDIYTEEEKAEDPQKENTGLFFFRGEPDGKAAICNAGGGFV